MNPLLPLIPSHIYSSAHSRHLPARVILQPLRPQSQLPLNLYLCRAGSKDLPFI